MNLYNEELRAIRVAIEQINVILEQEHYSDIKPLLEAEKEQYLKEIHYLLDEEDFR